MPGCQVGCTLGSTMVQVRDCGNGVLTCANDCPPG
jgi:hypothetical protein